MPQLPGRQPVVQVRGCVSRWLGLMNARTSERLYVRRRASQLRTGVRLALDADGAREDGVLFSDVRICANCGRLVRATALLLSSRLQD